MECINSVPLCPDNRFTMLTTLPPPYNSDMPPLFSSRLGEKVDRPCKAKQTSLAAINAGRTGISVQGLDVTASVFCRGSCEPSLAYRTLIEV